MSPYEITIIVSVLFFMCSFIVLAINTVMNTHDKFIAMIESIEKDEKECKIL